PEEADHVVLVDPVARDTEPSDELSAAIDRDRTGENLDAVLQSVLPRRDLGQRGAAWRRVGRRGAGDKREVLGEIAENESRLQPGRKRVELCNRARERARRATDLAIGEVGPRQVAARAIGKGVRAGQRGGAEEGLRVGEELRRLASGAG